MCLGLFFWQQCENCFVSCHVSFLYVIKYLLEKKNWVVISGKSRLWRYYHAKYWFHGDIPTKKNKDLLRNITTKFEVVAIL
jgi:hypothetical protein